MAGKSNTVVPSFFKILTTMDFTTTLRLPPAFSRKYESHLTGNVKVRSDSGRVWNVKMERMPNGGILCLTRGWHKFAEDAALQFGEFLVFSLFSGSEFDVQIYKTNFCERGLPPPPPPAPVPAGKKILLVPKCEKNVSGSKAAAVATTNKSCPKERSRSALYFETCLKEYQKSRLVIPMEFARAIGLLESRRHVRMEYVRKGGSSKKVEVDNQLPNYSRVFLAKGWHSFREANGLQFGKLYSFHFCPKQNAILVNQLD